MKIHFWGVRGSLATPMSNQELTNRTKAVVVEAVQAGLNNVDQVDKFYNKLPWYLRQTVGGDTTCVEVDCGGTLIIMDAGTGIRPLGLNIMSRANRPQKMHILISHTHWDHIAGFPFFVPAYIPGNMLTFYGPHGMLEQRLRGQQDAEYFPVQLDRMGADIHFVQLDKHENFMIDDVEIATMPLNHPGGCFAYRISHNGKTAIYATDAEYQDLSPATIKPFIKFYQNADLLFFDAQYTKHESIEKENWGHSTSSIGIDIALKAGIKNLVLTHHEPTHDDKQLWEMFQDAQKYLKAQGGEKKVKLHLAAEGLVLKL